MFYGIFINSLNLKIPTVNLSQYNVKNNILLKHINFKYLQIA